MGGNIPGTWEDAVDLWDENGMLLAKILKRGDVKKRHAMLNAAPDMLGALIDSLNGLEDDMDCTKRVRAAIAKAEGE